MEEVTELDHDNLEAFADAETYDIHENDAGVAFYTALAQETGGPVLELACGTGRVCIPIARLGTRGDRPGHRPGHARTGAAQVARPPIRWVEGDARTFDLGERFRLIFLTGNAFQMFLTLADQEALWIACAATSTTRAYLPSRHATRSGRGLRARRREATLERARLRGDLFAFLETRDGSGDPT